MTIATAGEKIDRFITYSLLLKEILEKIIKNPKVQETAIEELIKIAKGGRTRSDEMFFFTSLIKLEKVSAEDKQLFLEKHHELLSPDFTGKSKSEIEELRKKEKLAKGLIFLIAEDKTISDPIPQKRFQYAKEIWYGLFMGVEAFADRNDKLKLLEKRILHFGKNSQEGMTMSDVNGRVKNFTREIIEKISEKNQTTTETAQSFRERMQQRRIAAQTARRIR